MPYSSSGADIPIEHMRLTFVSVLLILGQVQHPQYCESESEVISRCLLLDNMALDNTLDLSSLTGTASEGHVSSAMALPAASGGRRSRTSSSHGGVVDTGTSNSVDAEGDDLRQEHRRRWQTATEVPARSRSPQSERGQSSHENRDAHGRQITPNGGPIVPMTQDGGQGPTNPWAGQGQGDGDISRTLVLQKIA